MAQMDFQLYDDAGVIFSPRDKSLLRNSLPILKAENKLGYIQFWGKIEGVVNDYYIVKGWDEYIGPARFFYSTNCADWAQVPEVDPQVDELCKYEQGLFIGDPTVKTKFRDLMKLTKKQPTGEEGEEPIEPPEEEEGKEEEAEEGAEEEDGEEKPKKVQKPLKYYTEDKRLAVAIKHIERHCQSVPIGYLYLNSTHHIKRNKTWKGLSELESLKLSSYLHQRMPQSPFIRQKLEVKGLSDPFGFLDPLVEDKPAGCWSLQYNGFVNLVQLRSLLFPGYQLFLRPNGRTSVESGSDDEDDEFGGSAWGQVYIGKGLMNVDFPFELPSVPIEQTFPHLLDDILKDNEAERKKKEAEEAERKRLEEEALREAEEEQEEEQM